MSKRVIVGMSGGVDSSVSAYLLKKQGHHVEGLFMKNWEEDDTDTYCSATQDKEDAQQVCDKLDIPLHVVNFASEYWDNVFTHFLEELKSGRTPNPDILCNSEIKFKAFLQFAQELGADCIATGHYARCLRLENNEAALYKGLDPQKDQSYFLHALNQQQLTPALFPVGELEKSQVRIIAEQMGFANHNKKDSTGICFIGERRFKTFLKEYLPAQPGDIVDENNRVLGQHDGLMYYTIGQRQGLQLGGLKGYKEAPWYVAKKDLANNQLMVVQNIEHAGLYQKSLITPAIHWINQPPILPLHCAAKTRYRQADQDCVIEKLEQGDYQVTFTLPQRAITPGQSVVFYQDMHCLGGGVIAR